MSTIILALALTCADMTAFQSPGMSVSITKTEKPADNLPARCRVDGVIDQRTGVDGKAYGIGFAIALPDNWNGRFLMQGGGGLNGSVANPLGDRAAAGDTSALARGFAVVTTDTGHKGTNAFDGSFMADPKTRAEIPFILRFRSMPESWIRR